MCFGQNILSKIFKKNKISASNARKQSEVYLYDIKISNIDGTSSITKTFVMQLKENTDFVMSFGVQKKLVKIYSSQVFHYMI